MSDVVPRAPSLDDVEAVAAGLADASLWFAAGSGYRPAGSAICGEEDGDPPCGWLSTFGALPQHRGRRLGTALPTHALAVFQERGLPDAGLGVDTQNATGALRRYERVGMHAVERDDTWELRP